MAPIDDKTIRWLCFDLDGTLIDARERQVELTAWLLERHGAAPVDPARLWRLKRMGADTSAALATLGYPLETVERVAQDWPAAIESVPWLARDQALPGVRQVLSRLRGEGRRIAVITARRNPSGAVLSVRAAGLQDLVDDVAVVAPSDVVAAKARRLGELDARWFVGDSLSDADAARLANVPFVAVATGQRSRNYLRHHGHDPAPDLHAAVSRLESLLR